MTDPARSHSRVRRLIRFGECAKLKKHLDKHPDAIRSCDELGRTPLHLAVIEGQFHICKMLIELKADVNAQDANGQTPLLLGLVGHKVVAEERKSREQLRQQRHWIPREAWRVKRVLLFAILIGCVGWLIPMALVIMVNPRIQQLSKWNVIERIDPLPRSHTPEIKRIAGSGNSLTWIDYKGHLSIFNRSNRVWRPVSPGPFIDAAPGMNAGEFMLLDPKGLYQLQTGLLGDSITPWGLPSSCWPVGLNARPPGPPRVLDARLVEQGVCVAIEGVGIGRYSLPAQENLRPTWAASGLSDRPIDKAVFTDDRVVFSLKGGGLCIGNLSDLSLAAEISTPEIVQLEANDKQQWAKAIDVHGGMWLAPREPKTWSGPFFSSEVEVGGICPPVNDLTTGLLHGQHAYLGSPSGMFSYSLERREISPLIPQKNIQSILPLPLDEGKPGGVIVLGESGVWVANAADRTHHLLDSGRMSDLSLSEDGRVAAFLRYHETLSLPDVRVVFSPASSAPQVTTASSAVAWRNVAPSNFAVRGVVKHKDQFVFATTQGGFLLRPETRTYTDASRVWKRTLGPAFSQPRNGAGLEWLTKAGEHVIASAGGAPAILHDIDSSWRILDPSLRDNFRMITGNDTHIVGLGSMGGVYDFGDGTNPSAMHFCEGKSPSLNYGETCCFPGDVAVTDDGHWRLAFEQLGKIIDYHSATGNITELEWPTSDKSFIQLRLDKTGYRLLASDGHVVGSDGTVLFGQAEMPFDPRSATAIAATSHPHQIFLGKDRHVLQYDWQRGRVTDHTADIPAEFGNVRNMGSVGSSLIVSGDNDLLLGMPTETKNFEWKKLSAFQRYAVRPDEKEIVLSGTEGMTKFDVESFGGQENPATLNWCFGKGMEEFVGQAAYVWNASEFVTAFFSPLRADVGFFDTQNESWQIIQLPELSALSADDDQERGFAVSPAGHLAIRHGQKVVAIRAGTGMSPKTAVYYTEESPLAGDIRWHGEQLQCAYVSSRGEVRVGGVTPFGSPVATDSWKEVSRGGEQQMMSTLDVVFVRAIGGNRFRMLNSNGGVGIYDVTRGSWTIERKEIPGQRLYRWFGIDETTMHLLLDVGGDASQMVTVELQNTGGRETECIRFPTSAERLLTWLAEPEKRVEPLLQEVFKGIKPLLARDWGALQPSPEMDWTISDGSMRIQRSKSETRLILQSGAVLNSSPQGGFVQDCYLDVVWDRDDRIWVLHKGLPRQLSALATSPEGFRPLGDAVQLSSPAVSIGSTGTEKVRIRFESNESLDLYRAGTSMKLRLPPSELSAAESRFGGLRLKWSIRRSGGISGHWTGAGVGSQSLPVWSDNGKLVTQVVRQIIFANDKVLLLATPLGLIARSAESFEIIGMYPGLQQIDILQGTDRAKIVVVADGKNFIWRDGKLHPLNDPSDAFVLDEVLTDPWLWSLQRSPGQRARVDIRNHRTQDSRRVNELEKTWFFADDRVNWLCRGLKDSSGIWLATDAGLWLTDEKGQRVTDTPPRLPLQSITRVRCIADGDWQWQDPHGRWFTCTPEGSVGQAISDPEGSEAEIRKPGLTVSHSTGSLTLDTNGPSVFVDGRFFFDQQTSIQSHDDTLYSIAGKNRWLVARDINAIGNIIGCWPLPLALPTDADVDLEIRDDQLVLRTKVNADRYVAWKIEFGNGSPTFEPWEDYEVASLQADLVAWRRTLPGDFRPYLLDSIDQPFKVRQDPELASLGRTEIEEFWTGDRFAWDAIEAAGILGNGDLVATTPLGLLLLRPNAMAAPAIGLVPMVGLHDIHAVVDSSGRRNGLLIDVEDGTTILVQVGPELTPTIEQIAETSPFNYSSHLRFEYEGDGEGQILQLKQYWIGKGESASTRIISSALPTARDDQLLQGGQFLFDLADVVCQVDDRHWFMLRAIPGTPPSSIWGRLERLTPNGLLQPVDCWRIEGIDATPVAILSEMSGAEVVTAVVARPSPTTEHDFFELKLRLQTAAGPGVRVPKNVQERFATGQVVSLDATKLEWNATRREFGSVQPPLVARPAEFPILVWENEGINISFDVFRSIAVRKTVGNQYELALGTRGGLHLYSLTNGDPPRFGNPDRVLFLNDDQGVEEDVARVRVVDETIWALFGERKQWIDCDKDSLTAPATAADQAIDIDGKSIMFPRDGGLVIRGSTFTHSNDAWWLGRQPIMDVTDFYVDPVRRELWVNCQGRDLFRVVIDAF